MFGSKLRSWMEAVRPRKKQNRKEKQKQISITNGALPAPNWRGETRCGPSQNDLAVVGNADVNGVPSMNVNGETSQPPNRAPATSSRYSANNLSSPESAYSTGYSTDGTSPGAPPDYYINIRTGGKCIPGKVDRLNNDQPLRSLPQFQGVNGDTQLTRPVLPSCPSPRLPRVEAPDMTQEVDGKVSGSRQTPVYSVGSALQVTARLNDVVVPNPSLASPRQRNRIRTNPWVPGSNTLSPIQVRQELPKVVAKSPAINSPAHRRFLSPTAARAAEIQNRSLSSSSCSSLSAASNHCSSRRGGSASEEDDCTLNEMMGKYDESYIYEKETDILSDSDPTDCDTDIDTGQDGGDEDDQLEGEFDFIDNGSFHEPDPREERNTGHCTYYNFEVQRKASRRRTTRRSKQYGEKRRSSNSKKRHKTAERLFTPQLKGSKSAGATPVSVRRTKHHPVSKLALEDCLLKKRSNSISFSRDPITTIDRRDKEADRKYKELIVEADNILRSMKTTGLSPRRVPGPANKRVEILRSAECARPEQFINKGRLIDEPSPQFPKMPSNNFSCPRFSPKRNHITNFINNNSPVLLRREVDIPASPLAGVRKCESPQAGRLQLNSPKYKRKPNKTITVQECSSSSTDSEPEVARTVKEIIRVRNADSLNFGCPQSEPVRRKVYSGRGKTVAFNLNCDSAGNNSNSPPYSPSRFDAQERKNSSENLRQQVLLNTIANLKRSLEDQSASLKQVYRSSHDIHV